MTTFTTTWPDAALTAELDYRRERLQEAARSRRHRAGMHARPFAGSLRSRRQLRLSAPAVLLGDSVVCR